MCSKDFSTVNWEDIIDTLDEEKCILFLGSGAYRTPGGADIEEAKMDWLDARNKENPWITLCGEDGFLLFRKKRFRRKVVSKLSEFYQQAFPDTEANFEKLARIPFKMIFSLSPDNILTHAFDKQGLGYQTDFYFYDRTINSELPKPTKKEPLIYNLLGNIDQPESLVLTQDEFYRYLKSILQEKSFSLKLRKEIEDAESYIFLGLPYEQWYFQLLLRILSLHSEKLKEVERLAVQEFEQPQLQKQYRVEFQLEFIPTDISKFIDELYEKCADAEILKSPVVTAISPDKQLDLDTKEVKELIGKSKVEEAFQRLITYFDSTKKEEIQKANQLTSLYSRFNRIRKRRATGTLKSDDFEVEHNLIVENLLNFISEIK